MDRRLRRVAHEFELTVATGLVSDIGSGARRVLYLSVTLARFVAPIHVYEIGQTAKYGVGLTSIPISTPETGTRCAAKRTLEQIWRRAQPIPK